MGPQTVGELVPVIFGRAIDDPHQLTFAFSEALAHVNFLVRGGRLRIARAARAWGLRRRDERRFFRLPLPYDKRTAMIAELKNLLPRIDAWPSEDQEALVEAARGIETKRTGVYYATAEELAAIDRGVETSVPGVSRILTRWPRRALNSAANDRPLDCRNAC